MDSHKWCWLLLIVLAVFIVGYSIGRGRFFPPEKPTLRSGTLVLLHGVSGSGKTTIMQALKELLPDAYLGIEGDLFYDFLADRYTDISSLPIVHDKETVQGLQYVTDDENDIYIYPGPVITHLYDGIIATLLALVRTGNNVLFDFTLSQDMLKRMVCLYQGYTVYFIGVHASLERLQERAQARGNRVSGLVQSQIDTVHAHGSYDFEVDTTNMSGQEAARKIADFIQSGKRPQVFEKLLYTFYKR